MLIVSYDPLILLAAVLISLMAAFAGLSLTNGISRLPPSERKPVIARAAIVLGGGVWSTHFVSMLALNLPVQVFYDPAFTLASALIAILMTGAALLLLHFGPRSSARIAIAGVVMGLGVVVMHYVGMFGLRGCRPVFSPVGYVVSAALGVGMSFGALSVAYGRRTLSTLMQGAVIYALAILAMHFSAMWWTGFLRTAEGATAEMFVSRDVLALIVMFAAFLICGAFLLTTATVAYTPGAQQAADADADADADAAPAPPAPASIAPTPPEAAPPEAAQPVPARPGPADPPPPRAAQPGPDAAARRPPPRAPRLPYEQDGRTFLVSIDDVITIQAEGHYTRLHRAEDALFCPIGINKLAEDLAVHGFLRTHRSHLVNLRHVRGFERRKGRGACLFDPALKVDPAPVSRANVEPTMRAIGI